MIAHNHGQDNAPFVSISSPTNHLTRPSTALDRNGANEDYCFRSRGCSDRERTVVSTARSRCSSQLLPRTFMLYPWPRHRACYRLYSNIFRNLTIRFAASPASATRSEASARNSLHRPRKVGRTPRICRLIERLRQPNRTRSLPISGTVSSPSTPLPHPSPDRFAPRTIQDAPASA